ncbi:hypothetical protein E1091_04505 [Micromonospora fluostatini]|uniref:Uncharacterized protein n=1 Tax=Micromonospora fluostatini TaxID=1629071 RepID=A0ABY2DKL1_9ACTN|nr:hypothetical protein E1091_04505 [Micromonospora fluostatini]
MGAGRSTSQVTCGPAVGPGGTADGCRAKTTPRSSANSTVPTTVNVRPPPVIRSPWPTPSRRWAARLAATSSAAAGARPDSSRPGPRASGSARSSARAPNVSTRSPVSTVSAVHQCTGLTRLPAGSRSVTSARVPGRFRPTASPARGRQSVPHGFWCRAVSLANVSSASAAPRRRSICSARVSSPMSTLTAAKLNASTGRAIIVRTSAVRPRARSASRRAMRSAARHDPTVPVSRPYRLPGRRRPAVPDRVTGRCR